MISYVLEYLQSILANAPTFEEIWLEVADAFSKFIEGILGAAAMGLLFYFAVRFKRSRAVREDGWYYLAPGLIAWFVLIGASLISLGTLLGGAIAWRIDYYKPSFDRDGWSQICMFAFFILGFGAVARASHIFFFRHKIRWNQTVIEKLNGRRMMTRIAWKDVQEIQQKAGADHLWIVSGKDRIKVWTHMDGVEQLISAINGDETAFGLLRQIRPTMESKPRPAHAGSFHLDHR